MKNLFLFFTPILGIIAFLAASKVSNTRAFAQTNDVIMPIKTEQKGNRRALLVGISKYESKSFPPLDYPLNDVARFAELLESPKYGFKVTRLTDETEEKPTKDNILKAIRKYLIDEAQEGDVCLFYFSGHGSSVKNTASDELDQRDETIVPSDAVRPVTNPAELKDIRDKELAELFNLAVNKKVTLTAIFDSCHSGSIARQGEEQTKEIQSVELDIKTPPKGELQKIKPEDRGALIITAAEDFQLASGATYSLNNVSAKYSNLTALMLSTLYAIPADLISAEDLFEKITAGLKARAKRQTPTLAGTPDRFEKSIFGGETAATTGRARVTAFTDTTDLKKPKYLQGGLADGLTNGAELVRIEAQTGKETIPPVRVRVTDAGLTRSKYEIIENAEEIKDGDTFEQVKWAFGAEPHLTVWLPLADLTDAQLATSVAEIEKLKIASSLTFVEEPTDEPPTNFIFPESQTSGEIVWKISFTGDTATETIGKNLAAPSINNLLTRRGVQNPKLFFRLPPSAALRKSIEANLSSDGGKTALAAEAKNAQYELIGKTENSKLKYAWALRSAFLADNENVKMDLNKGAILPDISLPAITYWAEADKIDAASEDLRRLAFKLGKISGLLKLNSPIPVGSTRFPYRLEIRETVSKRKLLPSDSLKPGVGYDFVLKAAPTVLTRAKQENLMPEFYLYLIAIDSKGASGIVKGTSGKFGAGGEGTRAFDKQNPPNEITLNVKPINLRTKEEGGSFGSETLILLISDKPLNDSAVRFSGVRRVEETKKSVTGDPLQSLLTEMGVTAKGESPDTWLVQQITTRSVEN